MDEDRYFVSSLAGDDQLDAIATLAAQNGYLGSEGTDFVVVRSIDDDVIVAIIHKAFCNDKVLNALFPRD